MFINITKIFINTFIIYSLITLLSLFRYSIGITPVTFLKIFIVVFALFQSQQLFTNLYHQKSS